MNKRFILSIYFTCLAADGPTNQNQSMDKVIDLSIPLSRNFKKEIIYNLRNNLQMHYLLPYLK